MNMKNNLKLKSLLSILTLVTVISLTGFVSAFSLNMKLDSSSKLKAGDTVEVTLKISNIDAGEGIDAVMGTLDYDKNVFEEVTEDNFEGLNKWNVNIYSTDSQKFTVTKSSKVNQASDILKLTLRAKSTISVDSTTITMKNVTASGGSVDTGGTGDIQVQNVSITISKETQNEKPPVTNEVKNEVTGNVTDKTNTNANTNSVTKINNISGATSGKLPQTGENILGIVAAITIVSIIAIVAFIKYRNINLK